MAYSMAAAPNPTPVEEGQVKVTFSVFVTYQLLP
jgi:uncharacterized protein YggE